MNTFIAVEGQPDLEFVAGLVEPEGFSKVVLLEQLDHVFCQRLITTKFPYRGDLHKRVPNPMFLRRDDDWIAIQAAGGELPQLSALVRQTLNALKPFPNILSGIGIVRDADDDSASNQHDALVKQLDVLLQIEGYRIEFPTTAGEVASGDPRFGVFILPDNTSAGTLEDLLLECGQIVYPNLIDGARNYVDGIDCNQLTAKDKSQILKPAGKKKAVVACAANVLKPGMSIAASIDQNRWLNDTTRELPPIKSLAEFFRELCGIA